MAFEDKTRAELVDAAARELRLVDASDDFEAADAVQIDAKVEPLLAELEARGVVAVPNPEAIPVSIFDPLGKLLAIMCEGVFGKPATPDAIREQIEDRLRVVVNNVPATNQYLKVDRSLTTRRPYWSLNDFTRG